MYRRVSYDLLWLFNAGAIFLPIVAGNQVMQNLLGLSLSSGLQAN